MSRIPSCERPSLGLFGSHQNPEIENGIDNDDDDDNDDVDDVDDVNDDHARIFQIPGFNYNLYTSPYS